MTTDVPSSWLIRLRVLSVFSVFALASCAIAPSARAAFHLWEITEVYSNASGTVQFIELEDQWGGQNFVNTFGATLDSNISPVYSFPNDLPGYFTTKKVLIATPGYVALGGGLPAPDFVLPTNNWFNQLGDTINFISGTNVFTFGVGQLPLDGTNSLNRPFVFTPPQPAATVAVNSPTNFAGATGTIPEPAGALSVFALLSVLGIVSRYRRSA